MYKLIQARKFKVKEEVLEVLLGLRVKDMKNSDDVLLRQKKASKELTHSERLIKKLSEEAKVKKSKKQKKVKTN